MLNSQVKNKISTPPVSKVKSKKIDKNNGNIFNEGSTSTATSRMEQLALPPIRTLIQNQAEYKHILSERGAEALEKKIKQSMFSRYGRAQDPYSPDLIIETIPGIKVFNHKVINKKPIVPRPISEPKTPLAPSRIELLAKPLKRRLPSPATDSPERDICHVKPSTLNYVANERIVALSQPKKLNRKMAKKISIARYKNFMTK